MTAPAAVRVARLQSELRLDDELLGPQGGGPVTQLEVGRTQALHGARAQVDDADRLEAGGEVGAVSAGVHAHRAADRTGDADRPLEAPDTGGGEPAGDDRQAGGATDAHRDHAVGLRSDLERRQARSGHDDQPGEAGVGDQQVRALPDDQQRRRRSTRLGQLPERGGDACQDLRIVDVHEPAGRSAHAVGAQRAERHVAAAT